MVRQPAQAKPVTSRLHRNRDASQVAEPHEDRREQRRPRRRGRPSRAEASRSARPHRRRTPPPSKARGRAVARPDQDPVEREHRAVERLHEREDRPQQRALLEHLGVGREAARNNVGEGQERDSECTSRSQPRARSSARSPRRHGPPPAPSSRPTMIWPAMRSRRGPARGRSRVETRSGRPRAGVIAEPRGDRPGEHERADQGKCPGEDELADREQAACDHRPEDDVRPRPTRRRIGQPVAIPIPRLGDHRPPRQPAIPQSNP